MDAALSLPLTLVVAQAGAGKTVLLNQWATDHGGVRFVWVDVEAGDDDPVRFARRLLAELAVVRPDISGLARMTSLNAGGIGGPLLQALAMELASFPELVIVLDDLHHLSNRTLLADLGVLVSAIPPNVHIVISTRVDPPIAWSGLRLRNKLLEIRQADLALTEPESAELLARMTGRDIPAEVMQVLVARTEGWAAGVQLAGITLRVHPDASDFVAEFGGTDRLIAEYLTEEVLAALPQRDRALLLRMSPLEDMTAGLVDHVLERSDALQLFERLERESMFLVSLDAHRERFRFHQLFRDLLRYRLRYEDPEQEVEVLVRAAEFHRARGQLPTAIEYLLRAGAWDRALDATMALGSEIFERGEMRTVIRWITTVPESVRTDRLDVSLELGILVGMQGEAAHAVDILSRVTNDLRATDGERAIAHAWISATTQWNPHPDETLRAAERAIDLLQSGPASPIPDVMRLTTPELLRTLTIGSGGRSHFLAGDLREAEAWLTRALDSEGIAYPPYRVGVLGSLALIRIWCGRAVEAELLVAEAFETAATSGLLAHPVIADAYLARAMVALERGSPDIAAAPLRDGTIRAEANHRTQLLWLARCQQAMLAVANGCLDEALELTDLSEHDAVSAPAPAILDRLIAARMTVLRRLGRPEESLRLRGGAAPTSATIAFETVAASLALGRTDSAHRMMPAMRAVFEVEGLRGDLQRLSAMAWTAELDGDHRTALDLIDASIDRAEPDGLIEVFMATDSVVLDLIAELAAERGGLAAAVIARRRQVEPQDANADLPEPLTERELEILAYLPNHSTSAELARFCFVSVNTLKTHMAHIYRKLAVTDRSAAIARARELGLLDRVNRTARSHA
ncbi:transcriptional regulator [Agromyces bauzanensis]|uniref:Transcriptional regulator n=2 Tax=Agromyces bauzanensis TaxID=1308924 RepID=A0A917UXA5_9MICO|nr:transcriptional regulator [Agromyces bauzanensis]